MSSITSKLVSAMAKIGPLPKDGENKHHKYAYTTAAKILELVQQGLIHAELAITETDYDLVSSEDGDTVLKIKVVVSDAEGNTATYRAFGRGMNSQGKDVAQAATHAMAYMWITALCLPRLDDDPEADDESDKSAGAYIALKAMLEGVEDQADLTNASKTITEAVASRKINRTHVKKLKTAFEAKKAEISK